MIPLIVRTIANIASVIINCLAIRVTFPLKYRRYITYLVLGCFTVVLTVIFYITGAIDIPFGGVLGSYGGAYGLLYMPLIIALAKGLFFQKVFVVISQLLISVAQSYLVMVIVEICIPKGSDKYYLVLLAGLLVTYSAYVVLMLKFGWNFMKKLFAFGKEQEWALYSAGALFSYAALMFLYDAPISKALYIFLLLFILWSFAAMCYAIINTHEKSRQRYEAELARSIVSSGREHYQKMDEMYAKLRIQKHDYKYHLTAINEMLAAGNKDDINRYMTEVQAQFSENDMHMFCSNSVINALLTGYAERFSKIGIEFIVDIKLPEQLPVPNYEMCIVLGNLLENAVEACQKLVRNKKIQLLLKPVGGEFALRVRNNFDGKVLEDEGRLKSIKKDGGLGLKSVEAVAVRYGGELITDWTDDTFTAYVTVML